MAPTRARSLAVALVALCSLSIFIDKAVFTSRVELVDASDGGRCDAKCQAAWIEHLKVVNRKLAAEHKKLSFTPSVPPPLSLSSPLPFPKPLAAQKWSAAAEIDKARAAARTPTAVKAQMIYLGLTGEVKRIKLASPKPAQLPHFVMRKRQVKPHHLASRHKGIEWAPHKQPHLVKRQVTSKVHTPADKVKVAESILDISSLIKAPMMNPKGKNKRVALAKSVKVGGKKLHPVALKKWPHDPHYWQRLGYGFERHQPWQTARKIQKQEQESSARSNARVDHTLDFMHVSGGRTSPVDSRLSKLGVEDNRHTFARLRTQVQDHTLDFMHVAADMGDPVTDELKKISGGKHPLQDHALDFLHGPKDTKHKVDIEAVDTVNSYEANFEPKGKSAANSYERQNLEKIR